VKALSTCPAPDTLKKPFLEYCSVYWGVYAKRELSDYARSLALELLRGHYGQMATELLLARGGGLDLEDFTTCFPFSALHCAFFFGIIEVVPCLIEMGCYDSDGTDFSSCTPLAWGHVGVVQGLLEWEGVNPDKPDNSSRTPHLFAVKGGRE